MKVSIAHMLITYSYRRSKLRLLQRVYRQSRRREQLVKKKAKDIIRINKLL